MNNFTATFDLEDDATAVVTDLLRQFPLGARVRLAIFEVPREASVTGLNEYRQRVVEASQVPRRRIQFRSAYSCTESASAGRYGKWFSPHRGSPEVLRKR